MEYTARHRFIAMRKAMGMYVYGYAKHLGISDSTAYAYEKGHRPIPKVVMDRAQRLFNAVMQISHEPRVIAKPWVHGKFGGRVMRHRLGMTPQAHNILSEMAQEDAKTIHEIMDEALYHDRHIPTGNVTSMKIEGDKLILTLEPEIEE